jgi:hypothetical protein
MIGMILPKNNLSEMKCALVHSFKEYHMSSTTISVALPAATITIIGSNITSDEAIVMAADSHEPYRYGDDAYNVYQDAYNDATDYEGLYQES